MAQRGLYPRKGPHTMENRKGADTGDPMAQRCFKVAAGVPMFPTKGYGVSGVGSKERSSWGLATSVLRTACLACPLWTMLGNCFKALPGTAAKKDPGVNTGYTQEGSICGYQLSYQQGPSGDPRLHRCRASRTCNYLHLTDEEADVEAGSWPAPAHTAVR